MEWTTCMGTACPGMTTDRIGDSVGWSGSRGGEPPFNSGPDASRPASRSSAAGESWSNRGERRRQRSSRGATCGRGSLGRRPSGSKRSSRTRSFSRATATLASLGGSADVLSFHRAPTGSPGLHRSRSPPYRRSYNEREQRRVHKQRSTHEVTSCVAAAWDRRTSTGGARDGRPQAAAM